MKVTREEIVKMAKLASLTLTEEEIQHYMQDLEDILNFAEIVNQANTEGLEETVAITNAYNVFRKDEIQQNIDREELLKNAQQQERGMFKIPKVMN